MDSEVDGKAFCKTVARLPGVYVMLVRSSDCLYVGKAKHLRNRLTSYFVSTPQSGKIQRMLSRAASIQVHITKTESEALLFSNSSASLSVFVMCTWILATLESIRCIFPLCGVETK